MLVLAHFHLVIFVLSQLLLKFPDLDHQLLVLGGFGGDDLPHLTNFPLHPLNLLFQTLNLLQSLLVVIGKLGISRWIFQFGFLKLLLKLTHLYIQSLAKLLHFKILSSQILLSLQSDGQLFDLYLVRMPIQLFFLDFVESTLSITYLTLYSYKFKASRSIYAACNRQTSYNLLPIGILLSSGNRAIIDLFLLDRYFLMS